MFFAKRKNCNTAMYMCLLSVELLLRSFFFFLPQILICALESCLDAALATEKAGDSAAATLTLSFALVIAITTTSREKLQIVPDM